MKKIFVFWFSVFTFQVADAQYSYDTSFEECNRAISTYYTDLLKDNSFVKVCTKIQNYIDYTGYYTVIHGACRIGTDEFIAFNSCVHARTRRDISGEDVSLNYQFGNNGNNDIPKVCGSVIDVTKKSIVEKVALDGTPLELVYSSQFNPQLDINKNVYNEVFDQGQAWSTFTIYNRATKAESSAYFATGSPVTVNWPWDEVSGNISVHPALSKGKFSIHYGAVLPKYGAVYDYSHCNAVGECYSTNNFASGNFPAYSLEHEILVYHPEVWGLHGWTLSNLHFFDRDSKMLFEGSGDRVKIKNFKTVQSVDFGQVDVVSDHYSAEILVFNTRGQHLETRTKITNAIKYRFFYSQDGKIQRITDLHGKSIEIVYDSFGKLSKIIAPYNQTTKFTVDGNRISNISGSLQQTHLIGYGDKNLMTLFTQPSGEVTEFSYDVLGNLIGELKNTGKRQVFGSIFSHLMRSISKLTSTGVKAVTEINQLSSTRARLVFKDGANQIIKSIDTSENDKSISQSGSTVTILAKVDPQWGGYYDNVPSEQSHTEANSNIRMYVRNDEVHSYSNPADPRTLVSINSTIQNSSTGESLNSFLNVINKSITLTDSRGKISNLYFNEKEQITRVIPSTGLVSDYSYDSEGRLSKVQKAADFESYAYDIAGFVASITNSKNQSTKFIRNSRGQVLTKILPNQDQINFEYSPGGQVRKITTSSNTIHNFDFGLGDYISGYLNPDVKNEQYFYDDDKRLVRITKPSGKQIAYVYKTGTDYVSSIETTSGFYIFDSDPQGRITSAKSSDNILTNSVWIHDKVKSQTWIDDDGSTIGSISNSYEQASFKLSQIKINDAVVADYGYSYPTGVLANIVVKQSQVFNYSLTNPVPNETVIAITSGQLDVKYSNLQNLNGGSKTVASLKAYEDPAMQLFVTVSRSFDSFGQASGYSIATLNNGTRVLNSYSELVPTYDSNNRIVQVQKNSESFINNQTISNVDSINTFTRYQNSNNNVAEFINSPSGGLQKRTVATFSNDDRLLSQRGAVTKNYAYDDDGNLKAVSSCHGTTNFHYDDFSNIKKIEKPGRIIEYKVDGFNRRLKKLVNNQIVEYYLWYDQIRLAAVLDANKIVKISYTYSPESNSPSYMVKNNIVYRIIHDPGLGSIRYVVNASTLQIEQELEYDESGNIMKNTNPGFQPLTFAGGLSDSDSKFIRFGARDYDPTVGRWTTKDPIGFNGGDTNLYAYVGGNPMSYVDPSGLTKADLDSALGWLRSNYSSQIPSDVSFSNFNMGADTRGASVRNSIFLNFNLLDQIEPPGKNRIGEYIQTLVHELAHSADHRQYGIALGISLTTDHRHNQIRNNASQMKDLYLNQLELQCKRR